MRVPAEACKVSPPHLVPVRALYMCFALVRAVYLRLAPLRATRLRLPLRFARGLPSLSPADIALKTYP